MQPDYSGPSDEYKKAIKDDIRKVQIRLEVTFSDKTQKIFYDLSVVKGSLYVDWRLVSNDDFEIGTLYSAELGVKLLWNDNPYIFRGAVIQPYFGLWIESQKDFEEVPLGAFYVSEVERHSGYVDLKALDYLAKMSYDRIYTWCDKLVDDDKNFLCYKMKTKRIGEMVIGCLDDCNVPYVKGVGGYTAELINSLAEDILFLNVEFENEDSVPTYRSLLSSALQLLGLSGVMNRNNHFVLRSYSKEPSLTLTPYDRFSLSYSDYTVENITVSYYNATSSVVGTHYPIKVDDNILMGSLSSVQQYNQLMNVHNEINSLSYTPCTIEYSGDPTIELGDMIKVEPIIQSLNQKFKTYAELDGHKYSELDGLVYGKQSDYLCQPFNTIVMHHHWVYRGKSTIHSYGRDEILRGIYKRK